MVREHRDVRVGHHGHRGGQAFRHRRGPLPPRVQDVLRRLSVEDQLAAVEALEGHQADLQTRHDAEVASPAAQRPEELRITVRRHMPHTPVGRDDLDGTDVVCGVAELPRQQPDTPVQHVGDRADTGTGSALRRSQPEPRCPLDDFAPAHPRPDPRGAGGGAPAHLGHAARAHQHTAGQRHGQAVAPSPARPAAAAASPRMRPRRRRRRPPSRRRPGRGGGGSPPGSRRPPRRTARRQEAAAGPGRARRGRREVPFPVRPLARRHSRPLPRVASAPPAGPSSPAPAAASHSRPSQAASRP